MPPFSDIMFHARPRMLKDFLQDETNSRQGLVKFKPSKSAFQAMVNALRSLSRKLSKKDSNYKTGHDGDGELKVITVRVKDIMRWKSFRDLVEEKSPGFASSPLRCTTATTTTTSGCSGSEGWSWCESDFSCEEDEYRKKDVGGETTTETEWVEPEDGDVGSEEEEQHSPLSVLDLQLRDDEFEKERGVCEWGHNKEMCIREMERGGRWSKFEEDQQEVCLEIEIGLFGSMIDELLGDL